MFLMWPFQKLSLSLGYRQCFLCQGGFGCSNGWNRTAAPFQKRSALSLHAYARLKRMQCPSLAFLARRALGIYLDVVMAPQPVGLSGAMARGLLTTKGTQDVDLIRMPAQSMNMHEVPFCFDFHENNITLECLFLARKDLGNAPDFNTPTRNRRKRSSLSARPVFETRAKCQDSVARYKDDGIPCAGDGPFMHFTHVHKSSAIWIGGTEWCNRFSNLHHPDTNIRLISCS